MAALARPVVLTGQSQAVRPRLFNTLRNDRPTLLTTRRWVCTSLLPNVNATYCPYYTLSVHRRPTVLHLGSIRNFVPRCETHSHHDPRLRCTQKVENEAFRRLLLQNSKQVCFPSFNSSYKYSVKVPIDPRLTISNRISNLPHNNLEHQLVYAQTTRMELEASSGSIKSRWISSSGTESGRGL